MAFGCSDIGRMYYYMAQGNCLKFQQYSKQHFRGEIWILFKLNLGCTSERKRDFNVNV